MALVLEVARKISLPHSIHCCPNVFFPYQPCYIMNNIYKYEGSDYHYYQTMLQVNISYTNQKQQEVTCCLTGFLRMFSTSFFSLSL
jgi:hypothetical protein